MTALPFSPAMAFFLDLDGTLFEIRPTPQQVERDAEEVRLVARLNDAAGGAVALISGRGIASIDALFAPLKLAAAGQHGAERRDSSGSLNKVNLPKRKLDKAAAAIASFAASHEGLLFENKGLSMALHYRLAPHLADAAHAAVRKAAAALDGSVEVQGGKMVAELKPAGYDKGRAIEQFMREPPFAGRVPLFIGDDLTDEHGFRVVNRLGGHSIKVGEGPSAARWRMQAPATVLSWLAEGLARASAAAEGRSPAPRRGERG
ncbi:MAG: trehalose-phosphatase [Betaproteobacteria bacterium]